MKKYSLALCAFFLLLSVCVRAAGSANTPVTLDPTTAPVTNDGWFSRWLNRVSEIQAQQPHWVTPAVTVTPRLEQEFRTDFTAQETTKSGHELVNYGNGKGLEFIPVDNTEVIFNVPAYYQHHDPKVRDGFGDFSALVKYRILSSPESGGNYIVTAFLGVSVPTGQYKNGSVATVYTPTIAGGKGYGIFDVQSTLGVTIPDVSEIGKNIVWNTAFQAHLDKMFWPELEFNYTHFTGGEYVGNNELFITPGIIVGRISIHNRVAFTFGGGFQMALTSFHRYDHEWIATLRMPF